MEVLLIILNLACSILLYLACVRICNFLVLVFSDVHVDPHQHKGNMCIIELRTSGKRVPEDLPILINQSDKALALSKLSCRLFVIWTCRVA